MPRDLSLTSEKTPVQGGQSSALEDYSFPRALAEIYHGRKSGTLIIRRGLQETRILINEGSPAELESTNPDDSLEQFLIKRGKLTQLEAYTAKSKAVETRRSVGEMLVELGHFEPNDLFRLLKLNMGQNLLAIFRWTEGEVNFKQHPLIKDELLLLELNPEPLIIRGVFAYSPFDLINKEFMAFNQDMFKLDGEPDELVTRLQLRGAQARVLRALRDPSRTRDLAVEMGGDMEALLRLLYALILIRVAIPADEEASNPAVPAPEAAAKKETPKEKPVDAKAASPVRTKLTTAESEAVNAALATAKDGNYYDLLQVQPDVGFKALKQAFIERCNELSPMSHKGKVKGRRAAQLEDLFLLLVRAYTTLSNAKQRRAYNDRLEGRPAQRKQRSPGKALGHMTPPRPRVDAQIKRPRSRPTNRQPAGPAPGGNAFEVIEPYMPSLPVKTAILFLKSGDIPAAVKELRAAVRKSPNDCTSVTLLGFTLYLLDPVSNMSQATTYLQHASSLDLKVYEPCLYLGRIFEYAQDRTAALQAYQQCLAREPRQQEARNAMLHLRKLSRSK